MFPFGGGGGITEATGEAPAHEKWGEVSTVVEMTRKCEITGRSSPNVDPRRWGRAEKKLGELFPIVPQDRTYPPFRFCSLGQQRQQPRGKRKTSHSRRPLSLKELQAIMANFARPVASSIAGVDFQVYSDEDIKAISVKRIHNTPTLDSFNNPVPGGLYDPAMGAWGDHT